MNRPIKTTSRPQMALQSYLDGLLQEATEELPPEPSVPEALPASVEAEGVLDEFQAAVLEEQARDARKSVVAAAVEAPVARPPMKVMEAPAPVLAAVPGIDLLPGRARIDAVVWPAGLVPRDPAEPGRQPEGTGYGALGDAGPLSR